MTITDTTESPAQPTGKAERWDKAALALLLLLTLGDAQAAAVLWDRLAPRRYRGMLLAEPIDDAKARGIILPSGWWFDVHQQRYGLGAGRVPDRAVRAAVDDFREVAQEQEKSAISTLYRGDTDIDVWQTGAADRLRTLVLVAVALGVGGIARLVADDLSAASQTLSFHLRRLERFAFQIERGAVNEEAAVRRAALYPESIVIGGYDAARQRSHETAGFTEEINILDPEAEHCHRNAHSPPGVPDCPSLTDKGWVPIGTLKPPGERICKWNCRCRLSFRRNEP